MGGRWFHTSCVGIRPAISWIWNLYKPAMKYLLWLSLPSLRQNAKKSLRQFGMSYFYTRNSELLIPHTSSQYFKPIYANDIWKIIFMFELRKKNMRTWLIITVLHTAKAVVKLKPEKIQTWTRFEPMIFAIPVRCSINWAITPSWSWHIVSL